MSRTTLTRSEFRLAVAYAEGQDLDVSAYLRRVLGHDER